MALKVWCHWWGLSLLCYLFYVFTFFYLIFNSFLYFISLFFGVWRFGVIDALLGRSFSLCYRSNYSGQHLPPVECISITLHHSVPLCINAMCTAHPSFVNPRIVELCINAKTFAHGASILQCTLCTDDINVQCDEQIVPVFWFHVYRFKWTVPEREKVRHGCIGDESRARALWADSGN